jgi:hypothetical protein
MKFWKALGVLLVLFTAPAAWAQVNVDWDPEAEFTGLMTYAWKRGTEAPSPLVQKRIEDAVNDALAGLGYEKVESGADFYVITHAALDSQTRVNVSDYGYSGGWYRGYHRGVGMGTTTVDVYDINVGTLMVDILDVESDDLMWRGVGSKTVSNKPEKNEKKIIKIVTKMFKKFPPPPDKKKK